MANRVLEVIYSLKDRFTGQIEKIRTGYRDLGSSADQSASKVEAANKRAGGSFGGLINGATRARLAIVAIGAAVVGAVVGIAKWAAAAAVQERAEVKLAASLRQLAGATDAEIAALKAQAAALQDVTGYGDEATISAQAMLATFGLTAGQIGDLTPRLLDMAEASRRAGADTVDLESIATQLGKAFAGGLGSLGEYGVAMSDAQKEAFDFADAGERVRILTEVLDGNFQGLAEAVGATYEGGVRRANAAQGKFLETLGKLFTQNKAYIKLSEVVGDAWESLSELITELQEEIGVAISAVARIVVGGFNAIRAAFNVLQIAIKGGTIAILEALQLLVAGLSKITFGDTSRAFELMARDIGKYSRELSESIQQDVKDLKAAGNGFADAFTEVEKGVDKAKQGLEDYAKASDAAADAPSVGAQIAAKEKAASEALKQELSARESLLRQHAAEVKRLADEQKAIAEEFAGLVDAARNVGGDQGESPTFLNAAIKKGEAERQLLEGNIEGAINTARLAGDMVRKLADEGEVSALVLTGLAKQIEGVANAAATEKVDAALIDAAQTERAIEIVKAEIAKAKPKLGGIDTDQAARDATAALTRQIEEQLAANPIRVPVVVTTVALADSLSDERLRRGIK